MCVDVLLGCWLDVQATPCILYDVSSVGDAEPELDERWVSPMAPVKLEVVMLEPEDWGLGSIRSVGRPLYECYIKR